MKKILWMAIAIGGIGCASASRIDRSADRHEARAQKLENEGNVQEATKERQAAAKQYSKANTRRGFEDQMPIAFF
jgi:outer membrane murein-binding lipoprotein Lpp